MFISTQKHIMCSLTYKHRSLANTVLLNWLSAYGYPEGFFSKRESKVESKPGFDIRL